MPLLRGEVQTFDQDRMILQFTMLNEGSVVQFEISSAAMDGLESRRDVKPGQRVDQFMRLRSVIEERAARRFSENAPQAGRPIILRSNDF